MASEFRRRCCNQQVERIDAFDTYERILVSYLQGLRAPWLNSSRLKFRPHEGKEGENLHFWVRGRARDGYNSHLNRVTPRRFRTPCEYLGKHAQSNIAGLLHNRGWANSFESPSSWRTMSTASVYALLPVNKETRGGKTFHLCAHEGFHR
ncbi:Gag protein [Phytophthora palmivora]|uniref:Gag protein n=1 Tax=Phytophthora palmivora TaxID=4796 RepID=A0A2P4Y1E0_9STRA|nr:Gag protein [Phytophthora palmivora]